MAEENPNRELTTGDFVKIALNHENGKFKNKEYKEWIYIQLTDVSNRNALKGTLAVNPMAVVGVKKGDVMTFSYNEICEYTTDND